MSILIKGVQYKEEKTDILIIDNKISKIAANIDAKVDKIIDGSNKAVIAGLVNCHTHSGMTVFRGFGDDMELESWLSQKIWPNETKLTDEIVYHATRLACLEMIKSGTTCFNDMYWNANGAIKAVEEMGIRATISKVILDSNNNHSSENIISDIRNFFENHVKYSNRINLALGPHAIYTVSKKVLTWMADYSKDNDILVHTHAAETMVEHENCFKEYGMTPVRFLNSVGLLSPRLIIAHCLWVDDDEINMLAENDVKIVHNPCSNLKLASGYKFKYHEMANKGIHITIGTDGCSSSNNLDMINAMKFASLIGKAWRFDPTATPAKEIFKCATVEGGIALRQNIGKIEVGYKADLVLVDLKCPAFTPNYNFISNLVYSANGNNVDTVICDGKVLMENKYVEGEEEILYNGNIYAHKLID